jgi:hypothetical protein
MESSMQNPVRITDDDVRELKQLVEEECGQSCCMQDAREFGEALLLWHVMVAPTQLGPERMEKIREINRIWESNPPKTVAKQHLPYRDSKALDFIRQSLKQGQSPSVREVCQVLGFRSSRSGLLVINRLIQRNLIQRNKQGVLELSRHTD